jgi:two-component system, OmpR family, phosphate regulon sensor histidine kinase PhoR
VAKRRARHLKLIRKAELKRADERPLMTLVPINRFSIAICLIVAGALAMLRVDLALVLGVVVAWLGSLWLARPLPERESQQRERSGAISEDVTIFLEPIGAPIIIVRRNKVAVANLAARAAFGGHIVGQDIRVGLRHPDVIALIDGRGDGQVVVKGLTTARSVWQASVADLGHENRLVELADVSAQSDIARAHTDFVANASHELRTPLASIIGYVETLMDEKAGGQKATRTKFLDIVDREARRMERLVEDLMSLSRIEAEKHDVPQDLVALGPLVGGVVTDVALVHGTARVQFDNAAGEAPTLGDKFQLDQMIRNLIDNALKYGGSDTPVAVRIAQSIDDSLIVTVTDQGAGIPAEHLPLLTRRFYRTDPGRSRAGGGTGLGLAIVKHIVERHKGQLDIASTVGTGTTVTVRLPGSQ